MGAKSSAPKTPDYAGLAQQQAQLDRQTAMDLTKMNRVNQVDPYGQTTWETSYTPEQQQMITNLQKNLDDYNAIAATKSWGNGKDAQADRARLQAAIDNAKMGGTTTQRTTLTPAQQRLLEQQQNLQETQNNRIGQLLVNFQTPTLKETSPNDIQNLLYGQITKQYADRFARQDEARKAELANQGFLVGSEGFNNSNNDFALERNNAYQDAATQAALSSYDQYNKERALNQSEYSTQMGYLSQLLGGVQGPTTPQYPNFAQATPYQSADLLGAAQAGYQGNLNRSNAQNAASGQNMATVGTLASAAAIAF